MLGTISKIIFEKTCVRGLCNFPPWPFISNFIVTHHESSEAVCPCIHSNLCFKKESWVNYITRVCHLSPPLCTPLIYYFHLWALIQEFFYICLLPSNDFLLSYSPVSHSGKLSSSRLWHNLVKTRDLICWIYLRTYDERETDGRKWQWQRPGYRTGGLPCQSFTKAWRSTRGWLGYLTKLKTEQSISHQPRKMTPLLLCV